MDEKWSSYVDLMFLPKSGIWPIFCQLMGILAKRFEIWTSNLFCPSFILTLIYKPSLKWINPKLATLLKKITKTAISQNLILTKCHSTKSLLLLHFFNEFIWYFQNQFKYGFCNILIVADFWFRPPKKIWTQNKKNNVFLGFWAQK